MDSGDASPYQKMFVKSLNGAVFMRPEYRELFAAKLKEEVPDYFSKITIKATKFGTRFWGGDDDGFISFQWSSEHLWYFPVFWVIKDGKFTDQEDAQEWMEDMLADVYDEISSTRQPTEKLTIKRSVLGWEDPITYTPIHSGEAVIRLNGKNQFIFDKKQLYKWWLTGNKRNPMTNLPVREDEIEQFIIEIEEDAGEAPIGGRRRRRRSTRRKNLRTTRRKK
jgi:hypothetical protein